MLRRLSRSEPAPRRGAVAVVVALSLVVLLAAAALTLDGGQALAERRHAQAAADTAALAGATDLFQNWQANNGYDSGGGALGSARAVAEKSGYKHGVNNITVSVGVPDGKYQGGPSAGTTIPPGYVEVIVQHNLPASFSATFGTKAIPVTARSVARSQWVFAPPIVVLNPTIDRSLLLTGGNGTVNVPNGPVYVNSSSASAMSDQTAATMVTPSGYYVTGDTDYPAGFTGGTIQRGVHPIVDPLLFIPQPTPSTIPDQTNRAVPAATADGTDTYNLQPGWYPGGFRVGSLFQTSTFNVKMARGVYYMDGGGFIFNSSGTLDASAGVMIFNSGATPGFVWIAGSGAVTIRPLPSSYGLWQGISVFQDRSATQLVAINHNSPVKGQVYDITGAVYAAGALVAVQRWDGDTNVGSQFISDRLTLNGTGTMNVPGQFVKFRSIAGVE